MPTVRHKFDRGCLTVIGVYAPDKWKNDETELHYKELQKDITKVAIKDHIILMGDQNARIGKEPIPKLIGIYGEDSLNQNGRKIREFVAFNELKITNTCFKENINKFI